MPHQLVNIEAYMVTIRSDPTTDLENTVCTNSTHMNIEQTESCAHEWSVVVADVESRMDKY